MWDYSIDFSKVKTKPLCQRINKFTVGQEFSNLDKVALAIKTARKRRKPIIWMMGAHSIKLGLSPYIINMMRNNYITHIATNGATAIHDYEIAFQGATSEDVGKNLKDGTFGNWEETGRSMNEALKGQKFMGYSWANLCASQENKEHRRDSIFAWALALEIPVTVHVAIGTDIIHQHPACNGEDLGRTSYNDFKMLTDTVTKLDHGVVINVGSAVILPEVFLKALSVSRNITGKPKQTFTTVVIDKNLQYRCVQNVINRPSRVGYYLQGQLEEYIPLLWERLKPR